MQSNYNATNLTGEATTTVKSSAGFLGKIVINNAVASATITIYDNTAASGTKIGTVTLPATLGAPVVLNYEVTFSTGLTIVTTGLGLDLTVAVA